MKKAAFHIRDPKNPRSLLYAYKDPHQAHCYEFHGICFAEFHAAMKLNRTLVLLADGDLDVYDEDPMTGLNFVEPTDLPRFAGQDIYDLCGDFIWVDTPTITDFQRLAPRDLAALLYMGRMFKPLGSPFFSALKNRFAYLAHDDGWVLRLYTRHSRDIARLLKAVIVIKARQLLKTNIPTRGLGGKLLRLLQKGILLDFRGISARTIKVSHPGRFLDMDALLDKLIASPPTPFAELTRQGWTTHVGQSNRT